MFKYHNSTDGCGVDHISRVVLIFMSTEALNSSAYNHQEEKKFIDEIRKIYIMTTFTKYIKPKTSINDPEL